MRQIYDELVVILTKKQKRQLFFLFILILGGAFCELVGVSAIIPFITAITNPDALLQRWYVKWAYDFLGLHSVQQLIIYMAMLLAAIYVFKNIYLCIMSYCQFRFTFRNEYKLSQKMLEIYINRSYEYHLNHNSAELIRNIKEDTEGCYSFMLCVIQLVSEIAVCVFLIVFLMIQDKSITIGVVMLLSAYVVLYSLSIKIKMRKFGQKEREQMQAMNKSIMESLGGIKETKILRRENYFMKKFIEETNEIAGIRTKYNILSYIAKPVVETLCIVGMLFIISLKIYRGVSTSYFIPVVAVFAVAAFRLLPSINRITTYVGMIMLRRASVDALYHDIVDISQEMEKNEQKKNQSNCSELKFDKEIEIRDITFKYEKMEQDVLSNINFVIPKNKSVAFVGPSGEGKTTMADILLGLLNPYAGLILVDGKDISERIDAWYGKLGYIPQTIFLLDDTIRNNIAFGVPEGEIDNVRLESAMKEAQIYSFIMELPDGLDTKVGERGVRLSGGQRQRIGIARALYNNPEILVLDEATSALDGNTEQAIMEAIDNLSGRKTLIIIAHRLSTIKNCDLVYKVSNKTVSLDTCTIPGFSLQNVPKQ